MPDYGKIISKSIETTKKFKWLWVYGLVIAAASGGSGSGNSNFDTPSGDSTQFDKIFSDFPNSTPTTDQVLGAFTDQFSEWFSNVSPGNWLLLFLGIVIAIVVAIGVAWVLSAWANGGLIGGLELAHKDQETTLKNTSPIGFKNVKKLIVLSIVQFFIAVGGLIALTLGSIIIGALVAALGDSGTIITVLLSIAGVIGFIYILINYFLAIVFSQRFVVLQNQDAWDAWRNGWTLSVKNFFPSLVMGIINAILSIAFGCVTVMASMVVLGVPAFILMSPLFSNKIPGVGSIIALVVLLIIFVAINLLMRAIMVVFNASNWNLFFEEINKSVPAKVEKKGKK